MHNAKEAATVTADEVPPQIVWYDIGLKLPPQEPYKTALPVLSTANTPMIDKVPLIRRGTSTVITDVAPEIASSKEVVEVEKRINIPYSEIPPPSVHVKVAVIVLLVVPVVTEVALNCTDVHAGGVASADPAVAVN